MSKKTKLIHTSGSRKTAIARATLRPGKGIIRVNKQLLENVNPKLAKQRMMEPLMLLDDSLTKSVDIDVNVHGGGLTSQTDAVRVAMCRALVQHGGAKVKETILAYNRQMLVSDTRVKEKSKPNRHGQARAKRQKSYR